MIDVPTIPPASVEVCDHYHQTVCPLVTLAAPILVTVPPAVDGAPERTGQVSRFEPINGQAGAWVRLGRDGYEVWEPLHSLSLVVVAKP